MDLHHFRAVPGPQEGLKLDPDVGPPDGTSEPVMDLPGAGMGLLDAGVGDDPVLQAIRRGADLVERLRAAQEVVAVSYAHLRFLEQYPDAVDDLVEAGRAVTRRVRAVMRLVALDLRQQKHASTEQVDLGSAAVKGIINLLVEEIATVATDVLPPDVAANVIERFRSRAAADRAIPWP